MFKHLPPKKPFLRPLITLCLSIGWGAQSADFAEAEGYDAATAHAPDYENRAVWPTLTGKEKFVSQAYEGGRVMEWAHPGKGIAGRSGLDVWDPENWRVDGEVPDEVVFDENTDLLLPDADDDYFMDFLRVSGWEPIYRHITVGRNARLRQENARIFGNIWIKKGGRMDGRHANFFHGGSTFLRNDNRIYDDFSSGIIGQYLMIRKDTPDTHLEVVHGAAVFDRVQVMNGTFIIGKDSSFSLGRNVTLVVNEEATLALMDGAILAKNVNQIGMVDYSIFGNLFGGLPDRPLTRPAWLGLSKQNTTEVPFDMSLLPEGHDLGLHKRIAPLVITSDATVRSHSAAPEGLLNLKWSGVDARDWHLSDQVAGNLSEEQKAYVAGQLDAIPSRVTAIFQENSTVDGLVFNDFHAGGILVEDLEAVKRDWKNIRLGENNGAEGMDMFTRIARATIGTRAKSSAGDYQVGIPRVFFETKLARAGEWRAETLSATVPEEAKGRRIGVRFTQWGGRGWVQIDDVELRIEGENRILNGSFSEPEAAGTDLARRNLFMVPGWELMGSGTTAELEQVEGESHVRMINQNSPFGQTTDYVAQGGESVQFNLKMRSEGSGTVKAELYYLEM
ncbi:MAG: hypothetical protein JJU05_04180 [Verrucomicrobia bacterium]|nr:hypothetical protein [Verrucomicrobiota bacterium]MCH8525529.1 hypothetical protein [Kiritimatiellia bacterium]